MAKPIRLVNVDAIIDSSNNEKKVSEIVTAAVTNPQGNEVLLYNASTGQWENKNVTVATGSSMNPVTASMIFG